MDRFTRFVLQLLGWRPCLGRDGAGVQYESWVRGYAYFHVYHERTEDHCVIRPAGELK